MKKVAALIAAAFLATSSVAYADPHGGFHGGFHEGFHGGGFHRGFIGPAIGLGLVGAGIAAGTSSYCWRYIETIDDFGRPIYVRHWVC